MIDRPLQCFAFFCFGLAFCAGLVAQGGLPYGDTAENLGVLPTKRFSKSFFTDQARAARVLVDRKNTAGTETFSQANSPRFSSKNEVPEPWKSYPLIPRLNRSESVFQQFLLEVEANKQRWAQGNALLPIVLYLYQIKEADSIFTISAKTSIAVEGIATLNRIEHPGSLPRVGSYILIPNNSGIFLPQDQSSQGLELEPYQSLSAWEKLLQQGRAQLLFHRLVVGKRVYFYYPRSQFTRNERSLFWDNTLRSPVQQKLFITSPFGLRRDPISGRKSFHDGLDIRSPYGAPIYSIKNGTVLERGESRLYGLYVKVRLDHSEDGNEKNQSVLYGHLTAVLVSTGQRVNAGEVIGNSGKSGRSTGPHLHLTIFENDRAINPFPLLKGLY